MGKCCFALRGDLDEKLVITNDAKEDIIAVKTILVLNGVGEDDAVTFALIVHTIQTSLTALLGVYAILALQGRKIRKEIKEQTGQPFNK